jgi:hypothetical protein
MEIRGLTPVDTLYEFAGYAIGDRFSQYLIWTWILPTLVIAAALLRLYYQGYQRRNFMELAAYPLYVLFVLFLVSPMEIAVTGPGGSAPGAERGMIWDARSSSAAQMVTLEEPRTVQAPRVVGVVHAVADALVGSLVRDMESEFSSAAFAWQRVAAINHTARILDPVLRREFETYLDHCYWPGMSEAGGAGWWNVPLLEPDVWLGVFDKTESYTAYRPNGDLYGFPAVVPCREYRPWLVGKLREHLHAEEFHRQAIEAYRAAAEREGNTAFGGARYEEFYLRRILYNEAFVTAGSNEASTVRTALPEYSAFRDRYWGTGNMNFTNPLNAAHGAASFVAAGTASMMEWWNQEALGPATYYRVSSLGPYIYGLVLAAMLSLWPSGWGALVNFLKVFISVKLWPVFWAFLSRMNVERGRFSPDDPSGFEGTFGQAEMFAALAGMYLLVPAMAYLLVAIAARAGQVGMGALIGPGATASGQAGNMAGQAARSLVP